MYNSRKMVQDWDSIKDQPPSRPPSSTPADNESKKDNSSNHYCHSCSCTSCDCDACLDSCKHCVSSCLKSSAKCCRKCVKCSKGLRRQGWRKWCLFGIVSILILIVIINISLTLWIMKIMEFNTNGMGPLRIYSGGLELSGKAYVLDDLIASSIKSRPGQPISINSYNNFTIRATDGMGNMENLIAIDNDTFTCRSRNLVIQDHDGKVLFSSSADKLVVGAKELRVNGKEGIFFEESVVTPNIESASGKSLRIESLTRSMEISSAGEMFIQSKAGGIEATTLKDIHFKSKAGIIRIDSRKISMPNLIVANASRRPKKQSPKFVSNIYQVCVCENGRLFLAQPNGVCEMYDAAFLCQ